MRPTAGIVSSHFQWMLGGACPAGPDGVVPALPAGSGRGGAHGQRWGGAKMAELDLLGSILSAMERPPGLGDQEARRRARGQGSRRGRAAGAGL